MYGLEKNPSARSMIGVNPCDPLPAFAFFMEFLGFYNVILRLHQVDEVDWVGRGKIFLARFYARKCPFRKRETCFITGITTSKSRSATRMAGESRLNA